MPGLACLVMLTQHCSFFLSLHFKAKGDTVDMIIFLQAIAGAK